MCRRTSCIEDTGTRVVRMHVCMYACPCMYVCECTNMYACVYSFTRMSVGSFVALLLYQHAFLTTCIISRTLMSYNRYSYFCCMYSEEDGIRIARLLSRDNWTSCGYPGHRMATLLQLGNLRSTTQESLCPLKDFTENLPFLRTQRRDTRTGDNKRLKRVSADFPRPLLKTEGFPGNKKEGGEKKRCRMCFSR